jgi:hypothetical protein
MIRALSSPVRPSDHHAELVSRVLFTLRRLDWGQPASTADRYLREALRQWVDDPARGVDHEALTSAARALRRRPEAECQVWADLVDAIRTGDTWALLAARYRNGESSRVLAAELGISDTTVLANLNRRGVPIRGQGGVTFDEATRARAVALYLSGVPSRDVAAEIGTAKNVVLRWVRDAGGEVRRPRGRRQVQAT